jgi:hypothetical protein
MEIKQPLHTINSSNNDCFVVNNTHFKVPISICRLITTHKSINVTNSEYLLHRKCNIPTNIYYHTHQLNLQGKRTTTAMCEIGVRFFKLLRTNISARTSSKVCVLIFIRTSYFAVPPRSNRIRQRGKSGRRQAAHFVMLKTASSAYHHQQLDHNGAKFRAL